MSSQLHTQATLPSGKEPAAFIKQEAGRAPKLVSKFWRREEFLSSSGNRTKIHRFFQPAAAATAAVVRVLAVLLLLVSVVVVVGVLLFIISSSSVLSRLPKL
jgi:Flp pilus assembly protein TadB